MTMQTGKIAMFLHSEPSDKIKSEKLIEKLILFLEKSDHHGNDAVSISLDGAINIKLARALLRPKVQMTMKKN